MNWETSFKKVWEYAKTLKSYTTIIRLGEKIWIQETGSVKVETT